MDYGKLAYQITNDLSNRITALEQSAATEKTTPVTKLTAVVEANILDGQSYGGISFTSTSTTTAVAVARLKLKFNESQPSLRIQFYCSDMLAVEETAAFGTGEQDFFTVLSFPTEKNALNSITVRFYGGTGGELIFTELLVLTNIAFKSEREPLAAVKGGGLNFIAMVKDSKLQYYLSDSAVSPLSAAPKIIDNVKEFAAFYYNNGFILALTDTESNLSIQHTSGGVGRYNYCNSVSSPAIVPNIQATTFAKLYYIKNGGLYSRDILNTLSLGNEISIDCGLDLSGVIAVSNSNAAQLIIKTTGNKLYYLCGDEIKKTQPEYLKVKLRTYCV